MIFTRADKKNLTVAMSKTTYIQSMQEIFCQYVNDTNTYLIVNKDPIRSIETTLKDMLTR